MIKGIKLLNDCALPTLEKESEEKISRQYAMQGMFQILIKNNLTLIQNFTKTTTLFERLNGASFILL